MKHLNPYKRAWQVLTPAESTEKTSAGPGQILVARGTACEGASETGKTPMY